METIVRTTQRKMVRAIFGIRRKDENGVLEDYVDWMKRSTRFAEEAMHNNSIPDWVQEVHRRRFNWAGRWTHALLHWPATGRKSRGRPRLRRTDSFNKFFHYAGIDQREAGRIDNSFWISLAADGTSWAELGSDVESFITS